MCLPHLCGRGFAGACNCRRTCHLRLVLHSGPWLRFLLVFLPRSSFLYPCDQTVFIGTVTDLGFLQFFLSKLHPTPQEGGKFSECFCFFGCLEFTSATCWSSLSSPGGFWLPGTSWLKLPLLSRYIKAYILLDYC